MFLIIPYIFYLKIKQMKDKNKLNIEENRILFSPYISIFHEDDNRVYLFFTYFNLFLKGLIVYFSKDFNFLLFLLSMNLLFLLYLLIYY